MCSICPKITSDFGALITSKKKFALGILTADWAPVFIYDPKKKIISAIHAGWKGAYKRILYKAIYEFKKKGSNIKELNVVIGPCISKRNYEVKKVHPPLRVGGIGGCGPCCFKWGDRVRAVKP